MTRAAAPASVGRFRILETLVEGRGGTEYAAYDPLHDRTVALEVVPHHGSDFQAAQPSTPISHPNVAPILDAGIDGGHLFVARERVSGGDLRDLLRRRQISVAECIALFAQISRGLHAVHEAGLGHLGFVPQIVRIAPDTRPVLTGVGVTRPRACTPRYASPEEFRGRPPTPAADQFSFGVAFYEALFSRHPFVHTGVSSLRAAVLAGHVVPFCGRRVPARVEAVLLRCLQTDPGERFESMADVADALDVVRPTWPLVGMALCAVVGLVAVVLLPGG